MRPEKEQSFTLVELMVVVLILGALTAIAIPRVTGGAHTAKTNSCRTNIDVINSQIELYYANEDKWPANLKEVTEDTDYFPDGPPECPFGKPYNTADLGMGYENRVIEHNHTIK